MAELVDVPICAVCGGINCRHGQPSELMVKVPAEQQIAFLEEALRHLEKRLAELQRGGNKNP